MVNLRAVIQNEEGCRRRIATIRIQGRHHCRVRCDRYIGSALGALPRAICAEAATNVPAMKIGIIGSGNMAARWERCG
jgi:hypothetical protein